MSNHRVKRTALRATLSTLQASLQEQEPYETTIGDRAFTILPGVFSPKYFRDTEIFARTVTEAVRPDEKFLEIGSGCGAVAITVSFQEGRRAYSAYACDINQKALENTRLNITRHQCTLQAAFSDVLGGPFWTERFDAIFWNTPFAWVPSTYNVDWQSPERAVLDPGYEATHRLIRDSRSHLTPSGRLLIGYSSTLGHVHLLKQILRENSFRSRIIAQEESQEGDLPVKFELFEARPRW